MKGAIDFLGKDKFDVLLINDQAGSARKADELIERYGMQAYPRVRLPGDECATRLQSGFGHFSWGYIVIGADGNLVATNVFSTSLQSALSRAVGIDPKDQGAFKLTSRMVAGTSFSRSKNLPKPRKGSVTLTLRIPEGRRIDAAAEGKPHPIKLDVKYAPGIEVKEPRFAKPTPGPDGRACYEGTIKIKIPIVLPKGAPIGHHAIHGTLSFQPADTKSPISLTWLAHCKIM